MVQPFDIPIRPTYVGRHGSRHVTVSSHNSGHAVETGAMMGLLKECKNSDG